MHDEVGDADKRHAEKWRKTVERIFIPAARADDEARPPVGALLEDKCPGHDRCRVGRRSPSEHEITSRLEVQDVETFCCTRARRKECADGNGLKGGHNAIGASSPTVIDDIVAIPSRSAAGTHLHQPRPHLAPRAPNRDRISERPDRRRNPFVARKESRPFTGQSLAQDRGNALGNLIRSNKGTTNASHAHKSTRLIIRLRVPRIPRHRGISRTPSRNSLFEVDMGRECLDRRCASRASRVEGGPAGRRPRRSASGPRRDLGRLSES